MSVCVCACMYKIVVCDCNCISVPFILFIHYFDSLLLVCE
jgi:hypothetical protein